ncbi:TIGR01621 family pseudouridine synthase [Chitinispirillales bacterium ANBcel5]|uniref:TIGR01621 family pseudouridine synthase n=1 Tax=Cellulosispirillum alkaliphilum TaxID=3039283 RepID=UPI002A5886FC|nr:TIGR01621 family pseudouridine synthase [Chitinispirillales bacterium ANBcel5]
MPEKRFRKLKEKQTVGVPLFTPVYKNEHFCIIDKDHGVSFHSTGLTQKVREWTESEKLYPVHRLDTMTSGLLLFALHKESAAILASQFRKKTIKKMYLAIGGNQPKKKQGVISGDMQKRRNGKWILLKTQNNPAFTRFFSTSLLPKFRLYLILPQTGKTHQIRVALKSIRAPIYGDSLYGKMDSEADRGYLHSYALSFRLKEREYSFKQQPRTGALFTNHQISGAITLLEEKALGY